MRAILWCLVMRVESRGEEFRASYVGLIVMRRKLESMAGIVTGTGLAQLRGSGEGWATAL